MMSRSTIFLGLMLTGSLALASFMGTSSSDEVVSPVTRVYVAKGHDIAPLESEALPLEKLVREGLSETASNPFAGRSWDPAPALPPAIPSLGEVDDKPSAPIVPFRYMGRIKEEGGRPVVFFTQGSQLYAVHEGEEIDGQRRHPQERGDRELLGDLVGDRQQHCRGTCGQHGPQRIGKPTNPLL